MTVYLLQHVHRLPSAEDDIKIVGVYSSRVQAEAAIVRLSQQPGFSELKSGFHIDGYELDKDHWAEGFVTV